MKKLSKILILTLALLMVLPIAVSASVPYATYTYSSQGLVLSSPDAYVPDTIIDAEVMGSTAGLGSDVRDLFVANDGKIYVVDGAGNRVIVLDRYYKWHCDIKSFTNSNGIPDGFNKPSGVFVDEFVDFFQLSHLHSLITFRYSNVE